jgi:hypothetical protein
MPFRSDSHPHCALIQLSLLAVLFPVAKLGAWFKTTPSITQSSSSRPCSVNPVLAPSAKSKTSKKNKHPLPLEALPVCLEVKGQAIEIQEFLQTAVRESQWRIGENHASEDTWSFVRYFNTEELEKYADTKVLIEPVEFTSGKVAVIVRTSDMDNGYVRVQIITHFQGEGKSTDKVWAQPGNSWPLKSRGVLEQEFITALQTRYKPTE